MGPLRRIDARRAATRSWHKGRNSREVTRPEAVRPKNQGPKTHEHCGSDGTQVGPKDCESLRVSEAGRSHEGL